MAQVTLSHSDQMQNLFAVPSTLTILAVFFSVTALLSFLALVAPIPLVCLPQRTISSARTEEAPLFHSYAVR